MNLVPSRRNFINLWQLEEKISSYELAHTHGRHNHSCPHKTPLITSCLVDAPGFYLLIDLSQVNHFLNCSRRYQAIYSNISPLPNAVCPAMWKKKTKHTHIKNKLLKVKRLTQLQIRYNIYYGCVLLGNLDWIDSDFETRISGFTRQSNAKSKNVFQRRKICPQAKIRCIWLK